MKIDVEITGSMFVQRKKPASSKGCGYCVYSMADYPCNLCVEKKENSNVNDQEFRLGYLDGLRGVSRPNGTIVHTSYCDGLEMGREHIRLVKDYGKEVK